MPELHHVDTTDSSTQLELQLQTIPVEHFAENYDINDQTAFKQKEIYDSVHYDNNTRTDAAVDTVRIISCPDVTVAKIRFFRPQNFVLKKSRSVLTT